MRDIAIIKDKKVLNTLSKVKKSVKAVFGDKLKKIILYGSYARGDNRDNSDIDLLILIEKDKITLSDEKRIKYPLFDIEFDTGQIISPLLFTKNEWENKHKITPFYENVNKEGIEL